jgi:hypothetical protein
MYISPSSELRNQLTAGHYTLYEYLITGGISSFVLYSSLPANITAICHLKNTFVVYGKQEL